MVIDVPRSCMTLTRVIIGGLPRCGTTLLGALLNSQPNSLYIADFLQSFQRLHARWGVRFDHPLDRQQRRTSYSLVSDEFAQRGFRLSFDAEAFRSLEELHVLTLSSLGGSSIRLAGHHSPLTPSFIDRLLNESAARVVLMLRDPRDATFSYARRFASEVTRYAEDWRDIAGRLSRWSSHPRFCALRYEDLVQNPAEALRPLERCLDLELNPYVEPLLYRRGRDAVAWTDNSAFGDVKRRFDPSPIGRWQSQSDDPIVRYVSWRCAREIDALGYAAQTLGRAEAMRYAVHATVLRQGSRAIRALIGALARAEKLSLPGT